MVGDIGKMLNLPAVLKSIVLAQRRACPFGNPTFELGFGRARWRGGGHSLLILLGGRKRLGDHRHKHATIGADLKLAKLEPNTTCVAEGLGTERAVAPERGFHCMTVCADAPWTSRRQTRHIFQGFIVCCQGRRGGAEVLM